MKTRRWLTGAVAAGGLMVAAFAVTVAAQRPIVQNDTPLPDRLLPTDQVVIVEPASVSEPELPVEFSPLTVNTAITVALRMSRAMFVATFEQATARLVEQDTWVRTFNAVRVTDTVKAPEDNPPVTGEIIDLVQSGGELTIKGVRVLTRNLPPKLFVSGHRYLVFTAAIETDHSTRAVAVYEVLPNGRLAWQAAEKRRADWRRMLSGRSLQDTVRRIRAMDRLMKRYPDK